MSFLHTTHYFYRSSLYLKIKEFNRELYKIQNVYLVPAHVGAGLEHVISVPSGDGDEGNGGGVVANLLDEAGHLLLDLLEPEQFISSQSKIQSEVYIIGKDQEEIRPISVQTTPGKIKTRTDPNTCLNLKFSNL